MWFIFRNAAAADHTNIRRPVLLTSLMLGALSAHCMVVPIDVPPAPARITVSPQVDTLTRIGDTLRLTATAADPDSAVLGGPVTWTSLNGNVATVDSIGIVRAVAVGTALIVASANGQADTATVLVQTLVVNAGPDQTIALTSAAQLNGSAVNSDAPGALKVFWSAISGPGRVAFSHEQFISGFEDGTVNEWVGDGGGQEVGGGSVNQDQAHTGSYSWKAYNDPSLPDPFDYSAKLLRWRFDDDSAYESAWYYWPSAYVVNGHGGNYANIFQWKENADPFDPTWVVAVVGATNRPGVDEFGIHNVSPQKITRTGVFVPKDRWFQITAFMKEGRTDGQLIVWVDGQIIYNQSGLNTLGGVTSANPPHLMWGVGNYSDAGIGKTIYVDDAMVVNAGQNAATTSATFSASGVYVLRLTSSNGVRTVSDDVQITVQ